MWWDELVLWMGFGEGSKAEIARRRSSEEMVAYWNRWGLYHHSITEKIHPTVCPPSFMGSHGIFICL